ncbi:unnamed protein product, partial [Mesorhabditis belari]|uniref:Uncharacterized protein n=1 Tax=Mesorhabditis belari TaxID=2138241 RepID=A0AAF3EDW1_9BILA
MDSNIEKTKHLNAVYLGVQRRNVVTEPIKTKQPVQGFYVSTFAMRTHLEMKKQSKSSEPVGENSNYCRIPFGPAMGHSLPHLQDSNKSSLLASSMNICFFRACMHF